MKTIKKFRVSFLLAALIALPACHHAMPKGSDDDQSQEDGTAFTESSAVLSKWLRSNVADYWSFAREENLLANYPGTGVVVGDTHLANFAPIPVTLKSGATEMKYLDVDFDDAGTAPFALDLLRLVVTSRATNAAVKPKEMVAAYVKGLNGVTLPPPEEIAQFINLSAQEYQAMADEDLDGKTNAQGFKFKPGKIEEYKGRLMIGELASLVPQINVIDIASRPVDESGDADARVWIYGKDKAGLRRLFEFKEFKRTRLDAYAPQADVSTWSSQVRRALWPEVARGEYELVSLNGGARYWLREKKVTLIDIAYSSKKKSVGEFVRALAIYDSNILGRLHGNQAEATALKNQLKDEQGEAAFLDAVKSAAKLYLHDVAKRL